MVFDKNKRTASEAFGIVKGSTYKPALKRNENESKFAKYKHASTVAMAPPSDKSPREQQKEKKAEYRLNRNNGVLLLQVNKLWNDVSQSKKIHGKGKQGVAMTELMGLIKGNVHDIIFKHDSARVIQGILKFGTAHQIEAIIIEIMPKINDLFTSRYGCFVASKIIEYGKPAHRALIVEAIAGNVRTYIKHAIASNVLEKLYTTVSAEHKFKLVLELYINNKETTKTAFPFTGTGKPASSVNTLREVLEAYPMAKKGILTQIQALLISISNKKTHQKSISHRVLREFLEVTTVLEHSDLLQVYTPLLVDMLHTRDGAKIALYALWHTPAKNRKTFLKTCKKEFIPKMATDSNAFLIICALSDIIDDTKLFNKTITDALTETSFSFYAGADKLDIGTSQSDTEASGADESADSETSGDDTEEEDMDEDKDESSGGSEEEEDNMDLYEFNLAEQINKPKGDNSGASNGEETRCNLEVVMDSSFGRKVLTYLIAPRNKAFFDAEIPILAIGDESNPYSKKDKAQRYAEIRRHVSPALLKYVSAHFSDLLLDPKMTVFLSNVLAYSECSAPAEADEEDPASRGNGSAKQTLFAILMKKYASHMAEVPAGLVYQKLIINHRPSNFIKTSFANQLWEKITKDKALQKIVNQGEQAVYTLIAFLHPSLPTDFLNTACKAFAKVKFSEKYNPVLHAKADSNTKLTPTQLLHKKWTETCATIAAQEIKK